MTVSLSVLDVSPVPAGSTSTQALHNTIDLARHVDALGYTRFWLAEHHNTPTIASTTPDIMIGQVARETHNLRVGSGGVMLPNHAPLKVAESFRLLEALFPGRIDLGIGRAPGTDRVTAQALRRSPDALNAENFPQELADLQAFAGSSFGADHPFRSVIAYPNDVALPPIWLLGSSDFSSALAAERGLGFAFAHHINADAAVPALRYYRAMFRPSDTFPQPHAILTVSGICADTDEEAEELALPFAFAFFTMYTGRPRGAVTIEEVRAYPFTPHERAIFDAMLARNIYGSPDTMAQRLDALISQTQADELMVLSVITDHAARLRSYTLLAQALGVQPLAATA
jgi:luciferase family oxidoreductase group 1